MVDYRDDFPQRLIKHMADGMSFTSFAAELGCNERTLRKWMRAHPEFKQARSIGKAKIQAYFERLGKRIAAGSLVRVAREEPVTDAAGNPVFDAHGKAVMKRWFLPVAGNATVWIFAMKNHCGWRNEPSNRVNVNVMQNQAVAVRNEVQALSDEEIVERRARAQKTLELAAKELPNGDTLDAALGARAVDAVGGRNRGPQGAR